MISLREDNPDSGHTLLTFVSHGNEEIRRTIDNSSISGVLVSAAMRYVIADKYGESNHLIEMGAEFSPWRSWRTCSNSQGAGFSRPSYGICSCVLDAGFVKNEKLKYVDCEETLLSPFHEGESSIASQLPRVNWRFLWGRTTLWLDFPDQERLNHPSPSSSHGQGRRHCTPNNAAPVN